MRDHQMFEVHHGPPVGVTGRHRRLEPFFFSVFFRLQRVFFFLSEGLQTMSSDFRIFSSNF